MFDVTVTNNSPLNLKGSDGKTIGGNGGTWKWSSPKQGAAAAIETPYGSLGFQDIGDVHVPGDSGETWGVLIGYQAMSVVGRYEGQGTLGLQIDQFLQVSLQGMDFREVMLQGLVLPGQVAASA